MCIRDSTEGDQSWCMQAHNQTLFQSTPSSRRATRVDDLPVGAVQISIHALLTEGDSPVIVYTAYSSDFNPRPPHGGRLMASSSPQHHIADFNPRPPHGGRQDQAENPPEAPKFQSTPSSRRATHGNPYGYRYNVFQSTPSSRRATEPYLHGVS